MVQGNRFECDRQPGTAKLQLPMMADDHVLQMLTQVKWKGLSGLLLEASLQQKHGRDAKAVLTVLERTKFREMVRPGDSVTYRTQVTAVNQTGGKVSAEALLGDRVVVTTGMVFAFKYIDDPLLERKRAELMEIWRQTTQQSGD